VSGGRFLLSIFITQGIQTMDARLITVEERSQMVAAWSPTVGDAAKSLGVSGSTIRRKAAKLGVRKLSGRSVAGFVLFESHPVPVVVAYSGAVTA
jgi:hypothetical protein